MTSEIVWWVKLRPMTPVIRDRIVGLADARQQQELNVEDRKGGEDHEVGRLLPFLAARIDKGDAGRAFAGVVDIDARHLAFGAVAEVRFADQHRQNRRLRAGLRIVAAAEPFAEAAIGAGSEPDAERIRISLRQVAGGLRKRLVAEIARGLGEQRVAERLRLRRIGIGPRARSLERIAAFENLPFQIACRARRPAKIFELVVMRLEVVIGDATVLDRHVVGQKIRAISLRQMRLEDEVGRQEAPGLRVPVDAPAADAVRRHERAPGADRQRLLAHLVAESEGGLLRPQKELVPDAIAQLVLNVGGRKIGRRVAPWARVRWRRRRAPRRSVHARGSSPSSRGR